MSKFEDLFGACRIGVEEVIANPAKHLMVFRPSMLADFHDELPPDTLCLYSRWAGYLENEDWKRTEKILARNSPGGASLQILHTTGHILPDDIVRFIKALAPKTIVPIHTFCPDEFGRRFENVYLPQDGEAIQVC